MADNPKPPPRWGTSPPKPPSTTGMKAPTGKIGWTKAPTGAMSTPMRRLPPAHVGRAVPEPRRSRRWIVIVGIVVAAAGLLAGAASLVVGSIDRPPTRSVEIDPKHFIRWDKHEQRTIELVEGFLFVDGEHVAVMTHFAPKSQQLVWRVQGKQAAELREKLKGAGASSLGTKLKYLSLMYTRFEQQLRIGWGIQALDDLAANASKVEISVPSTLFVRLELRVAPFECLESSHQSMPSPPCSGRREGWLSKVGEVMDLR